MDPVFSPTAVVHDSPLVPSNFESVCKSHGCSSLTVIGDAVGLGQRKLFKHRPKVQIVHLATQNSASGKIMEDLGYGYGL